MSVLKKSKSKDRSRAINNRYRWVEFVGEDGEVYRAKVRTGLIYAEIERLVGLDINKDKETLWEQCAPYVSEWNIQVVVRNEDGTDDLYDVAPPLEGGPESFKYAPATLFLAIVGSLMNENFSKVDP